MHERKPEDEAKYLVDIDMDEISLESAGVGAIIPESTGNNQGVREGLPDETECTIPDEV